MYIVTTLILPIDSISTITYFLPSFQYLAWMVLVGLHQSISMSLLLVGHTTFSPDWCFGLIKQRYQCTCINSLQDIADIIETSSDVNFAQLVGTQNGDVIVPMYHWDTFLSSYFRKVPHLKSYHNFTFATSYPGLVTLKEFSDSHNVCRALKHKAVVLCYNTTLLY